MRTFTSTACFYRDRFFSSITDDTRELEDGNYHGVKSEKHWMPWSPLGRNFQSDMGVLFRSTDGGLTLKRVDMGVQPKSTMFGLAFDERDPRRMYCATSGGEVFGSQDNGTTWNAYPLPEGATQVYALARA